MIELSSNEARVIGSLLEKQMSTPEQYPLSVNALVNACNQKSNREPVMNLSEQEVESTLGVLKQRHLVLLETGPRVRKYQQRLCNTDFSDLQFSQGETAIIAVLLLRGPQTPGELRSRTQRLHTFETLAEVEAALDQLMNNYDRSWVEKLDREPGRRECRFRHCFSRFKGECVRGGTVAVNLASSNTSGGAADLPLPQEQVSLAARVDRLEAVVAQIQATLEEVRGAEGVKSAEVVRDA